MANGAWTACRLTLQLQLHPRQRQLQQVAQVDLWMHASINVQWMSLRPVSTPARGGARVNSLCNSRSDDVAFSSFFLPFPFGEPCEPRLVCSLQMHSNGFFLASVLCLVS